MGPDPNRPNSTPPLATAPGLHTSPGATSPGQRPTLPPGGRFGNVAQQTNRASWWRHKAPRSVETPAPSPGRALPSFQQRSRRNRGRVAPCSPYPNLPARTLPRASAPGLHPPPRAAPDPPVTPQACLRYVTPQACLRHVTPQACLRHDGRALLRRCSAERLSELVAPKTAQHSRSARPPPALPSPLSLEPMARPWRPRAALMSSGSGAESGKAQPTALIIQQPRQVPRRSTRAPPDPRPTLARPSPGATSPGQRPTLPREGAIATLPCRPVVGVGDAINCADPSERQRPPRLGRCPCFCGICVGIWEGSNHGRQIPTAPTAPRPPPPGATSRRQRPTISGACAAPPGPRSPSIPGRALLQRGSADQPSELVAP